MKAVYYIHIAVPSQYASAVLGLFSGVAEPGCSPDYTLTLDRAGVPYRGMNPSADDARLIEINAAMGAAGALAAIPLWATIRAGDSICIASSDPSLEGEPLSWDQFMDHFNLKEVMPDG